MRQEKHSGKHTGDIEQDAFTVNYARDSINNDHVDAAGPTNSLGVRMTMTSAS